MRRALAVLLSITILAPGCATARTASNRLTRESTAPGTDRALLTVYLQQLPVGSRIRASLADGHTVRGTLMRATNEGIVVQRRSRIPEPPMDIPIEKVRAVEIDTSAGGVGRAVAIGAAAGAGASLGVLLLLAAIFAGD